MYVPGRPSRPLILTLDKPAGWTPLEALDALRASTPALGPMTYAGRLDPMAEGLLLVLTDADRFALREHLTHDKEYVATVLFGVASDSHDALGRLTAASPPPSPLTCSAAVCRLPGVHRLPLPAWSAFKVRGRPLHTWASEGRLAEVELPTRDMTVAAVTSVTAETRPAADVTRDVVARIALVRGAFRQAAVVGDWEALAAARPPLVVVQATLAVTSGTYVRALAHELGAQLGCGALLLALRRTRVGPYGGATALIGERPSPASWAFRA